MPNLTLEQAFQQALAHHLSGDLQAAETLYRAILQVEPNHADTIRNLQLLLSARSGDQFERTGVEPQTDSAGHKVPSASPEAPEPKEAARSVLSSSGLAPLDHLQTLMRLFEAGRYSDCEIHARQLIQDYPEDMRLWKIHGSLLAQVKHYANALPLLQRALDADPHDPEIHNTLGVVLTNLGRVPEAMEAYRRALKQRPGFAEAHNNLGTALMELKRYQEAEASFRRALSRKSDYPVAISNLGNALKLLGRLDEALDCQRRALRLQPDAAAVHSNLGLVLKLQGHLDEAMSRFRRAIALQPDLVEPHVGLCDSLRQQGRLQEAETLCRQFLARQPEQADVLGALGLILKDLDRLDESIRCLRQALAIDPTNPTTRGNLLFVMAYTGAQTAVAIRDESREWERYVLDDDARQAARNHRFSHSSRSGRPLRVGVLSADFGQHAVSYFLLPWMRALDTRRIRLSLYPTATRIEPEVEIFRALNASWTPLAGISDTEALARIRADEIDVLIDTSGHTTNNRLDVIARRAAPVQCHYIGYFATTGLSEMDYFIADATLIPPRLDEQFTERLWRLERPWLAYAPLEAAPEPNWRTDTDATLWIGSFNNLVKVRDECLELWAAVLQALPQARLLLKDVRGRDRSTQHRIRTRLEREGIAPERLVFAGHVASWHDHMAQYDRLDMALDPIPLTGGTTVFDALWMGVPVVTLAGERMSERMGAAVLTGLGRSEWIAHDAAEYISIAVSLAHDVAGRRAIRDDQRQQMRNSPLCDGIGMARAFEDTFEQMFDLWWNESHQMPSRRTLKDQGHA